MRTTAFWTEARCKLLGHKPEEMDGGDEVPVDGIEPFFSLTTNCAMTVCSRCHKLLEFDWTPF